MPLSFHSLMGKLCHNARFLDQQRLGNNRSWWVTPHHKRTHVNTPNTFGAQPPLDAGQEKGRSHQSAAPVFSEGSQTTCMHFLLYMGSEALPKARMLSTKIGIHPPESNPRPHCAPKRRHHSHQQDPGELVLINTAQTLNIVTDLFRVFHRRTA